LQSGLFRSNSLPPADFIRDRVKVFKGARVIARPRHGLCQWSGATERDCRAFFATRMETNRTMATANASHPDRPASAASNAFLKFSEAEREAMKKDDATAFGIVAGELVAIVILGFVLVGITLLTIVLRT
jgi:hypothetical protein